MAALSPLGARADEPSPWADSDRPGDLVYFGAYGGVSFASVRRLTHVSEEGGRHVLEQGLPAKPSWTFGYSLAFWPYDFFGLDTNVEFFGLPLTPDGDRFDVCEGGCRLERTAGYDGAGVGLGFTLRGAVPLRYVAPSVGVGLQLPATFLGTNDPVTRLDTTAIDFGPDARVTGGLQIYADRTFRISTEYRFDYRLAQIAGGRPLETEGFVRHSLVLGLAGTSEDYQKAPEGDKLLYTVAPYIAPVVFWVAGAVIKAAVKDDRP